MITNPDWSGLPSPSVIYWVLSKERSNITVGTGMRRIIKNAIQCKLCGEVIESTYRHEYVQCKCGACAVDGGHDYLRRSAKDKDCYIDLSESVVINEEENR